MLGQPANNIDVEFCIYGGVICRCLLKTEDLAPLAQIMSEFPNFNKIMMEISGTGHQQSIRTVISTFPFYYIPWRNGSNVKEVSGVAPGWICHIEH